MNHKGIRRRQARLDALVDYLRQRQAKQQPVATIGELATHFKVSRSVMTWDIQKLELTGQITVQRDAGYSIIPHTIVVTDWTPD